MKTRIELNFHRIADDPYYQAEGLFSPPDYTWYGDKEGRALLAFVSLYRTTGRRIPCMETFLPALRERTRGRMALGPIDSDLVREQQLSGHSWLLRGLCEHHEAFGDAESLDAVAALCETLFLPLRGRFAEYPLQHEPGNEGGVVGSEEATCGGWVLSTDVGCAFMCLDGLSHAYKLLRDSRILSLLDEAIGVFRSIDRPARRMQTHCTLSAGRGLVRLWGATGNAAHLAAAEEVLDDYVHRGGMTDTYQNLNWWGRPDTWTEPCAIVDSLMLALELRKATGRPWYRRLAARVWQNGFATAQRPNGGAGTDSVVAPGSPWNDLRMLGYDSFFCCTMRLSEGLAYAAENEALLAPERDGGVVRTERGTYRDGDILYVEPNAPLLPHAEREAAVRIDGRTLYPVVKLYRTTEKIAWAARQQVVFP